MDLAVSTSPPHFDLCLARCTLQLAAAEIWLMRPHRCDACGSEKSIAEAFCRVSSRENRENYFLTDIVFRSVISPLYSDTHYATLAPLWPLRCYLGYLDVPDSESVYFFLLNSCSARTKLYVYFMRVQAISKMCFCTVFA